MKKRILAIIMVAAMAAGLAACGNKDAASSNNGTDKGNKQESSAPKEASGGEKYHIGICQLQEHEALDAATKGFMDCLKEKLGEENVEFDEQNAQGEAANCATICNNFVSADVDLILANATASLQSASAATNQIPILGTSITDYATALSMSDFSGTTGTNISGTSDLAPIDQQEDMIVELLPDTKQVGIVYCSAEPNSKYQAEQMEKYLKEDGIAYKEYTAADSNEIQSVVTKACSESDCLYVPTDNTMAAAVDVIKNVAIPAGIPMVAGEAGICKGGIATLSISYYDLGYQTGEMAYDILVNGADIKTMEIATAPQAKKLYNKENCEALNIKVPDGYEELTAE